jgi:HK97 family phage prohead protease
MGMMKRIRDALAMTATAPGSDGPKFAIGPESIPPEFYGLTQYDSNITPKPRVSRRLAIQVPALLRGRNLICTPIGGLALKVYNRAGQEIPNELFEQPERDVPRSVTMTYLVEDMLFEQTAWWRVTEWRGPNPAAGSANPFNYPKHVRRLEPRSVDPRKDGKVYVRKDGSVQGEAWEYVPDTDLIRFDSPTDGILTAGAGAISTLLMLDNRAYNSANNPVPEGYFTPKDGVDPFDEEDPEASEEEQALLYTAAKFLADWRTKRLTETTAWVPGGVDYNQLAWDPEKLQLAEARQHAVLEIARLMGLDPEDVAVSTTSRTYFNAETKRQDRIDFVLGMFLNAIADRLSMGDITPRGQRAAFDVDAFTMTDTKTRLETYEIGLRIGLWTLPELRAKEGLPPLTAAQLAEIAAAKAPPAPPQIPQGDNVTPINRRDQRPALAAGNGQQFDDAGAELQLQAMTGPEFKVDLAKRTISGLALPYGGAQAWNQGELYEFAPGSVTFSDPKRIKVYVEHDSNRVIGYATQLEDRPEGLFAELKIANVPEGDHALLMASEGLWDGLSAGFRAGGRFTRQDDGVLLAAPGGAPLKEISLCPVPAFDDARVTAVALSAHNERNTMKCTKCGAVHAAGVVACDPAVAAAFTASTQAGAGQTGEVQLSGELTGFDPVAFQEQLANAIGEGFATMLTQAQQTGQLPGQREVIAAAGAQQFQVTEELPYRFDGSTKGEHCFTDDLRDSWSGSGEAKGRLEKFMEEAHQQFAVTTGNTSAFNPVQNRPELYVPSLEYTRPLFELATTGTLQDITPFTVPKFSSASGLVGPHTQGVEPTPGAFAATVQTVTPTAISGKVEINREVWDQGGNPQTDTIVWREMQNAYYEAAEVGIATMLNALSAATLYSGAEVNLAGATDAALNTALTNLLVDLQYVRGGNRYTSFAAASALFKAIAGAKDSAGRPLFPLLGPANANGQLQSSGSPASSANVLGQTVRPAWALNSTPANASNSYLFVPSSVWAWLSPPKRFTFEYQVKSVDMAVWGYTGSAVLRNSDVVRIDYETADV